MACRRSRRSSRGGRDRRAGRGRRSRGQLLRTVRVQRRHRRNLRARPAVRARDAIRRGQRRTPGLRGRAGRDRPGGGASHGRIWGACPLLHVSLRAVASAHSRRKSEQTGEHENRERRCHHDGRAHDTRTHDKCFAGRLASLAVTRRAVLRLCMPETLGVPRQTVLCARLREGFGSRQEIVIAPVHGANSRRAFRHRPIHWRGLGTSPGP
jgi:hypothetical protein